MEAQNMQSRSLWLGDIEVWMDENYIIKAFKEFSIIFIKLDVDVKGVKIIRDKFKGVNLGYGFIEFENQEIAGQVLNDVNGCKTQDGK